MTNKLKNILEKIDKNEERLTAEEVRYFLDQYAITREHAGKMKGLESLSTSPAVNPFCIARAKCPGLICAECYAQALTEHRTTLGKKLERNTAVLSGYDIAAECFPPVFSDIFRLEAFGDLNNRRQFLNYCRFAAANPGTIFTLWTKNPGFTDAEAKPENMIIIYSEPEKDTDWTPEKLEAFQERFPAVDKVFTVFTVEGLEGSGASINCGARNCYTCRNCYRPDGPAIIRELLKKDTAKAKRLGLV